MVKFLRCYLYSFVAGEPNGIEIFLANQCKTAIFKQAKQPPLFSYVKPYFDYVCLLWQTWINQKLSKLVFSKQKY